MNKLRLNSSLLRCGLVAQPECLLARPSTVRCEMVAPIAPSTKICAATGLSKMSVAFTTTPSEGTTTTVASFRSGRDSNHSQVLRALNLLRVSARANVNRARSGSSIWQPESWQIEFRSCTYRLLPWKLEPLVRQNTQPDQALRTERWIKAYLSDIHIL